MSEQNLPGYSCEVSRWQEHLGSDPAADRLALNLAMHWAGN